MWGIVAVTAFLGTRAYVAAFGPIDRAAAMAAVCILPAFGAQGYGDIGLQQPSCTVFLGMAIAIAANLSVWGDASTKKSQALRRSP
jgi:hypothetical protein